MNISQNLLLPEPPSCFRFVPLLFLLVSLYNKKWIKRKWHSFSIFNPLTFCNSQNWQFLYLAKQIRDNSNSHFHPMGQWHIEPITFWLLYYSLEHPSILPLLLEYHIFPPNPFWHYLLKLHLKEQPIKIRD